MVPVCKLCYFFVRSTFRGISAPRIPRKKLNQGVPPKKNSKNFVPQFFEFLVMDKKKESTYEKILTIHPSGNLVSCKKFTTKQSPFNIQEVSAFVSRQEIRKNVNNYLHNITFLPMPIHVSPIICYMSPSEWDVRYCDSVMIISLFVQFLHTYVLSDFTFFHTHNKERIEKEYKTFKDNINNLERKLIPQLKECSDYKQFVVLLEQSTIDRINIYEELFYHLLQLEPPLECFLTPRLSLPSQCLSADAQKNGPNVLCHFFDTKQHISCENEKDFPFDIRDMRNRLGRLPPTDIYNGYMDRLTAEEYMKFIKNFVG